MTATNPKLNHNNYIKMAREVTITVTGKLPLDAVKAVADQVQIAERTFERMGVYEATKKQARVKGCNS